MQSNLSWEKADRWLRRDGGWREESQRRVRKLRKAMGKVTALFVVMVSQVHPYVKTL